VSVVFDAHKNGSYLAVILAYPCVVPRITRLFEYFLSLWLIKIFSLKRVILLVDDFDPPVEAAYTFSETRPSLWVVLYWRALDVLTLKFCSSIVLVVNNFFKHHIARIYRIRKERLIVVSNGSLIKSIPYVPPKSRGSMVVLYAGSAMKVKDIDKLVLAVDSLMKRGLDVRLRIAGVKMMKLPDHVHVDTCNWPNFPRDVLSKSDLCVIPYPPSRFMFDHTMLAKLSDYMGAGKPVISTNLKETGNIISMYNCGLVANDWEEFELHIERLYHDRALAKTLGLNGRKAAEEHFNYETLAEAFLEKLVNIFKVRTYM
jgi:glycosyltransferase involved in cell wall biosynthesis